MSSTGQIAKALAAAQAKIEQPKKDRTVQTGTYSYDYATLDSIMGAVRGPLSESGIAVCQCLTVSPDGKVMLETRLLHESGEQVSSLMPVTPAGAGPQAMGSAISYARRYSIAAILGVVAEEDDDGSRAEGRPEKARERKVRKALEKDPPRASNGDLVAAIRQLHASNVAAGCKVPAHTNDPNWPKYTAWLKGVLEIALGQPVSGLTNLTVQQVDEARVAIRRMLDNNEVEPWKGAV